MNAQLFTIHAARSFIIHASHSSNIHASHSFIVYPLRGTRQQAGVRSGLAILWSYVNDSFGIYDMLPIE